MPLKCLIGISNCYAADSLRIVGTYVRWFEMLSLAGIVFAISQFIENNRLRAYILQRKTVALPFYGLILFSILSVVLSTILSVPLVPIEPIPLISYPTFWELLSLFSFSLVMLGIILISMFPRLFIPKFNRRNYKDIYQIAADAILYNGSKEAIAALCKIIHKNLLSIINYASQFDKYWNVKGSSYQSPYDRRKVKKKDIPIVATAVQLIDELLSHDIFCQFIAERHLSILIGLIDSAEKKKLWNSCGYFFYNNVFKWLFEDPESLMSQELKGSGISYSKLLSNKAFKSFGVIANYRIFQSYDLDLEKLKAETIKKVCHGLELSLKEYFKKEQLTWHADTPNTALGVAVKNLAEIISQICMSLARQKQETWESPYSKIFREISFFFDHSLPNTLPDAEDNLSVDDKEMNHRSILGRIVDAIFNYLEGLSWLTNSKFARDEATCLSWILWPDRSCLIIDKLKTSLFEKIKTRIYENKKQHYPSLLRLLFSIYGFQFPLIGIENQIGKFVQNEFYGGVADLALRNSENANYFLPSNWKWDLNARTIANERGQQLFPLQPNIT